MSYETVQMPEQEIVEEQFLADAIPEDPGVAYQLKDGTIVHAESIDAAVEVCPYLASKPPEVARLMAEIAALGAGVMKPREEPPETVPTLVEKTVVVEKKPEPKAAEKSEQAPEPKIEQQPKPVLEPEVAFSRDQLKAEPEPDHVPKPIPVVEALHKPSVAEPIAVSVQSERREAAQTYTRDIEEIARVEPAVVATPVEISIAKTELPTLPETPRLPVEHREAAPVHHEALVRPERTAEQHAVLEELADPIPQLEAVEPLSVEPVQADLEFLDVEADSVDIMDEPLEVVQQSVVIPLESLAAPVISPAEESYAPELSLPDVISAPTFEVLVATNHTEHPIEQPSTVAALQERAPEQPVVQTLVQLAEIISVGKEPEQEEVRALIQEVIAALPDQEMLRDAPETWDVQSQITPEVTEKILMLLRDLGYEQPKEVIFELVDGQNMSLFLQALQYISALEAEDYRGELLHIAQSQAASDDISHMGRRLGTAILQLLSRRAAALDY